jgi:hypothetical protein
LVPVSLTTYLICTDRPGATIVDVEVTLPSTPVALAPGVPTRVPVELSNPFGPEVTVRVVLARGRAAGWAVGEPVGATIEPGGTATVELVLQAPADQPPSAALVPFSVAAQEWSTGEPAGFGTGLLTVALPVPVTGAMIKRAGQAHVYDLRLVNESNRPAGVRISTKLDPPLGTATVEPAAAQLEPGGSVMVAIKAKPARPPFGGPKPYAVVVAVNDAADLDRPPLLSEVGTGVRRPRVANWAAATIAIVVALGATAAVFLSGVHLPAIGRNRTQATAPAPVSAAVPTVAPVTITKPYALVDVLVQRGADNGQAAAEAERAKLAAQGMPVRLVDSRASDVLAGTGPGFWVLLQDGFTTVDAATAFCTQWRSVAPKCRVTA